MPNSKRNKSTSQKTPHVAILVYDGLCTFEFAIAVEMFALPRPELDRWYTCSVCSSEERTVNAVGGITVHVRFGLRELAKADMIVIPGWKKPFQPPSQALLQALRAAYKRGVRLVSFCVGAYVLASAGLLDGRKAATHWKFVSELRDKFPSVTMLPDVLYVDEGNILTAAGSAAGIDLCLHVIRRDFGPTVANNVARRAVVAPHREGGQAQFIDQPVGEEAYPWLSNLLQWAQERLPSRITIQEMAKQAHTSKRTLSRRFAQTTGMTPVEWLTTLRLRRAKDLLETTMLSIEEIAEQCGFGSAAVLRHHFRTNVKLSPNTYRERFRQNRSSSYNSSTAP